MQKEISTQYLITARQFVAEGYADKIRRSECRVYEFDVEPPTDDAPEFEKFAYENLKANGGLFNEVINVEHVRDGFYMGYQHLDSLGNFGMSGDHQLLVITQENWQADDGSQNALEAD